jgi:hypothetical protein
MSDPKEWPSKHRELIFVCRAVADRWGEEVVDMLAARHRDLVREAFRKEVARTGRNDMAALAEKFGRSSGTHDYEMIRADADVLEFKITRCWHAEFFNGLNACDVGLKFMCAGDDAMIEGFNPRIALERPSVMMRGEDCCHFIYRWRSR